MVDPAGMAWRRPDKNCHMRVLLAIHQFLPEYSLGTEVLTYSVAQDLMRRGHDVRVFTGHPSKDELDEDQRLDEYQIDGIHVYRFHHAYTPMADQTSMVELSFDNHLAAGFFAEALDDFKPEVVHFFHLNRLGTGLIDLARQAGIPAFMTPTDFWVICPTAQLVWEDGRLCQGPSPDAGNCVRHFAQSRLQGSAGVLARYVPTPAMDVLVRMTRKRVLPAYPFRQEVEAIGRRLGVNVARINRLNKVLSPNRFMTDLLLRHGIDPALVVETAFGVNVGVNDREARRKPPRRPFRIGYIGTLAPYKGCHVLLEAFKTLAPGQAILQIYGSTTDFPDYAAHLRGLAGDRDDIAFQGVFPNSRISEVLYDLDVLVVPSLWFENTPLVVYSAQATGCPVLASDFPGISEAVEDGINGLLFQPGKSEELAMHLSRLVDEPDLARSLSENSKPPKATSSYVDELLAIWSTAET